MIAVPDRAIDQVLLAQRHELTSLPESLTLQSSGGRKGPARTTLTLVLDLSDGALSSPVNSVRGGKIFWSNEGDSDGFFGLLQKPLAVSILGADHLVVELVSKVVHLHGVGGTAKVGPLVVPGDPVVNVVKPFSLGHSHCDKISLSIYRW